MHTETHSTTSPVIAAGIAPIAADGTITGATIDTAGFGSLEYVLTSKNVADGTHSVVLQEGDMSDNSDMIDVTADFIVGDLPIFGVDDDDTIKKVGSVGKKRYQRLKIVSIGVTSGIDSIVATALLCHPNYAPVS